MPSSSTGLPLATVSVAAAAPLRFAECLMLQAFPVLGLLAAGPSRVVAEPGRAALLLLTLYLLYLHIFAFNDWANLEHDRQDPGKAARLRTAGGWIPRATPGPIVALALLALGGLALFPPGVSVCAAILFAASVAYSHPRFAAKGVPFVSTAIHLVSGAAHFLAGALAFGSMDATVWALAAWSGLVLASGHYVQEAQDVEADRAAGVATHATRFGVRPALLAGLSGFTVSYALLGLLVADGRLPRSGALLLLLWLPLPAHFLAALRGAWSARRLRRLRSSYRASFALTAAGLAALLWLR